MNLVCCNPRRDAAECYFFFFFAAAFLAGAFLAAFLVACFIDSFSLTSKFAALVALCCEDRSVIHI
jgi:hypothetical protein